MPLPNPARQKTARDTLQRLFVHTETVFAVHYACESLYSGAEVQSPRIGAIAVKQLSSGQVTSFSIPQVAELNRLTPDEIGPRFAAIEQRVLEGFFAFVRENRSARLVHWHMTTPSFGFAALAHRLEVLGGTPHEIHESQRIDLAGLLEDLYGDAYAPGRAKLASLATLNELVRSGFLEGRQEAAAMAEGRYRDAAASTATKVAIIAEIAARAHDRTLKTGAGLVATHAGPARLMLMKLIDNPGYALASGLVGGFLVVFKTYEYLFGG